MVSSLFPDRRLQDPPCNAIGFLGPSFYGGPFFLCAEYERQLGGGSPLSSLMVAKD